LNIEYSLKNNKKLGTEGQGQSNESNI